MNLRNAALALVAIPLLATGRGSTTHPQALLEVKAPVDWVVSYCTISGPGGGSYSWATPGTEGACYFGYLNYAGTYTITVYEESPARGPVTSEQLVVNPLQLGQPVPSITVQMEAE
jgi:hypothetical protein